MPSVSIGIELASEPFLIPIWFYSYSFLVYAISALISALVAYFAYKFFKMTKTKSSLMLVFSFLFLTAAYSTLSFTSLYTYLYKPYFQVNFNLGSLSFVNSVGLSLYYITSMIAYVALFVMYLPEIKELKKLFKREIKSKLSVLYVPLWYQSLMDFHLVSILILAYVALRNVANFYKKRDVNSFLVMSAFILIVSSHAALLFLEFDPTIYIAANTLLVAGFSSLLIMLIRVSSGGKSRKSRK